MKFEKGKQYECIKDVVMDLGDTDYIKGRVYTCENEGCLTDETGDEFHSWSESGAKVYFKLHEPEPKLGDKVLVWDDDQSDAKELIFLAKVEGEHPYLVVTETSYTEYKAGRTFKGLPFKNMKPLPQVETVSLKEALSILEAHKGVKCRIEGCE